MTNKILSFLSFIGLFFLLIACNPQDENPDAPIDPTPTFTLENDEEQMPVWVHGQENANLILVPFHGGPGSDVLDFRTYQNGTGFKRIEEDYLVAYWQQRASGQSKGPTKNEYYNLAQYVEDADRLIDELKTRYPDKEVVILGHSWGGYLSSAYFKEAARRNKVKAWIDAAGAHNYARLDEGAKDLIAEAETRIALGENVQQWEDIQKKVTDNPSSANRLAYESEALITEIDTKINIDDFKFSNRANSSNVSLNQEIDNTSNTEVLKDIMMPCLVIWGEYDFAVSKALRDEAFENLGTSNKQVVTLDKSAHYMMFNQPNEFAAAILTFLDSL